MMSKLSLILILALGSVGLCAQEEKISTGFDVRRDIISDKYEAGAFLIYDCEDRHWVCVLESYYKACAEKRAGELATAEALYHSCAPVGEFPNKWSCFQRQLFLTTHNHGNNFCVRDEWKGKNVPPP